MRPVARRPPSTCNWPVLGTWKWLIRYTSFLRMRPRGVEKVR